MNVLFVSLDIPFPPQRGQRMRNWAMLRALAAEGHRIRLISFAEPGEIDQEHVELRQICCAVDLVPAPSSQGLWAQRRERFRAMFSPLPFGARRFRSPRLQQQIQGYLASHPIDVVIWDEVYNLINLLPVCPVPVLLNSHDLMQVIWGRYFEIERNPLKRAYSWLEFRKLCRWEPRACARVSGIIACSKHDGSLYEQLCPQVPCTIATNSVDVSLYTPAPDDDGETVLFVGGMDWFPNADAVEMFAFQVIPQLRKRVGCFKFVVAGRGPSPRLRSRFQSVPEVVFTGVVPDMRLEIARCAVSVVPLRIGSGVRWKILEAAAMGKAIVTTTIGVEGLEFANDREIVIADEPAAFAQAVADLLKSPVRRRMLGAAARRRVEAQYSSTAFAASINEALAPFAAQASRRRGAEAVRAVNMADGIDC